MQVLDPDDDSITLFGLDNDELIRLEACLGDEAFLLTIDDKIYQLSNSGVTLVYFDTDRNLATRHPYASSLNWRL